MSVRQTLVKIVPKRFIPDAEISSVGGNDYETSFVPKKPSAVYRNDVSLSFSYADGVLTFTSSSSPSSNIYIEYPLRFSVSEVVNTYDDPLNETGDIVEYEPRLSSHVTMSQSSKNMLNGVMSINSSGASLINTDYGLNDYFTKYDTFYNRPFYAYAIVDDTTYLINNGSIKSVSFGDVVSLRVKDNASKLEAVATFGNAREFYEFNSDDYPSGNSSRYGEAIPFAWGKVSQGSTFQLANPDVDDDEIRKISPNGLSISMKIDSSNNYLLGVVRSPYPAAGLTINVTDVGTRQVGLRTYRRVIVNANHVKAIVPGAGKLATSHNNGATYISGFVYSVSLSTNEVLLWSATSSAVTQIKIPSCYYNSAAVYDATVFQQSLVMECYHEATTQGDTIIKVRPNSIYDFYPALEADLTESPFILTNNSLTSQTSYVSRLIESAGFNVEIQGQAQTLSNNNVQVTHGLENGQLETYLKLLEDMANSNNALAYTMPETVSGEQSMGYRVVFDSMDTDTDINIVTVFGFEVLNPKIGVVIAYQDQVTKVTAINPTTSQGWSSLGARATASNDFGLYMSDIETELAYDSYIIEAQEAVNKKLAILKQATITYKFSLDSESFIGSIKVGDIVRLKELGDKLPIQDTDLDLLIIGVDRAADTIKVTGYDYTQIS